MADRTKPTKPPRAPMLIGWRERVGLPDLGLARIEAKIDTGARTSALHATRIVEFDRDGVTWVRFHIPHAGRLHARNCEAPLLGQRSIKNTSGVGQDRHVISTRLLFGVRAWRIEVSLTDRASMKMPLILGRTAFRQRGVLVDAGKSYLTGEPTGPKTKRKAQ